MHLLTFNDPGAQFRALATLKEAYDKGGVARMRYTTPSIVSAVYRLIQSPGALERNAAVTEESKDQMLVPLKVFQFAYQAIDAIGSAYPELALRLFMQGVLAMNATVAPGSEVEELGYQFASQALVLFQDELVDAEAKMRAIIVIVAALQRATFFSPDNFETLATNAIQYCGKLTRKQDQCRALIMCSHLFASEIAVRTKGNSD